MAAGQRFFGAKLATLRGRAAPRGHPSAEQNSGPAAILRDAPALGHPASGLAKGASRRCLRPGSPWKAAMGAAVPDTRSIP
jgi:hypothetical protein